VLPDGTLVPGGSLNDLAVRMAIQATRDLWESVHQRIVDKYGADQNMDAECLFTKLAWGGGRACHRRWHLTSSGFSASLSQPDVAGEYDQSIGQGQLSASIFWDPVRYAGPNAPAAETSVHGQWTITGVLQWQNACNDAGASYGGQVPIGATGDVSGTMKVTPDQDPIEDLDAWEVSYTYGAVDEPCIGQAIADHVPLTALGGASTVDLYAGLDQAFSDDPASDIGPDQTQITIQLTPYSE